MAFRGYGDDALKEKKDLRANATKRASIAASERASQRSAGVQMAGLGEKAREADMADDRANTRMGNMQDAREANVVLGARSATIREDESAANIEKGRIDTELGAENMALQAKDREDKLALKLEAETRQQRQLAINEETFLRMEEGYQKEAKIQEAWQSEDTAMGIAIARKMVTATGPIPEMFFNPLNQSRGLKKGDKGYISGGFPIIDPKTKEQHGWGMTSYGKDGEEIQSVLEPTQFLEKLRKSMAPQAYTTLLDDLELANGFKGVDATKAAIGLQRRKLELDAAAKTIDTITKGENTIKSLVESAVDQSALGEDKVKSHIIGADTVTLGDKDAATEAERLTAQADKLKGIVGKVGAEETGAATPGAGNDPTSEKTDTRPQLIIDREKEIMAETKKLPADKQRAYYEAEMKKGWEEYKVGITEGERIKAESSKLPEGERKAYQDAELKKFDESRSKKVEEQPVKDPKAMEAEKKRRQANAKPVAEKDNGAPDGGEETTGTITKAEYEQAKKEMASGHPKANSSDRIVQYKKENRLDTAGMWKTRKEKVAAKRKAKTKPKMSKGDFKDYTDVLKYEKENPNGRGMDQIKSALSKTYGFDYHDWDILEPTQED